MKIIKNEKLIKRNGTIGNWTSLVALLVLGGGMYISFTRPDWFVYSLACLVIGFVMTQVGMYMGNRWGRSPRRDEKIDAGLKGLHSEFSIYHYTTPTSHLLVGPSGIWVILAYQQIGTVTFEKNRWKIKGGGFMQSYMRIFGQEGIGRPDLEAETEVAAIKNFLAKKMEGKVVPEIQSIMVFLNDQVVIEPGEASIRAIKLKQLKGFIRETAKQRKLTSAQVQDLNHILEAQ
ncbi:MAG: hypothetical protein IPG80_01440 [Anaerolineales bacterium]|jgi:hypothetical protein|uniref:hypothetical protein n=1 Tax=Candidatus Villigracilis vicinus TaxID=3140679 RepID=UPI0031361F89|nr:hypothetical protein [Anaerolineales bacterium]MBK7449064.1 hypothetical protein [Anaerolineales bacterium]